jgi:hypothetical protein
MLVARQSSTETSAQLLLLFSSESFVHIPISFSREHFSACAGERTVGKNKFENNK